MKYVDKKLVLTDCQVIGTLEQFYKNAANEAGYTETEDIMYDCRKILVAPNIQDAVIGAYQGLCPGVSVHDILIYLAISGPKVCEELGMNEVIIQNGFITAKALLNKT